jgi:hypothetical protein
MKAFAEKQIPDSCLNKAEMNNETVFVLRSKDPTAFATIHFWIDHRIAYGLNTDDDPKIKDAAECARIMRDEWIKSRVDLQSLKSDK